MKRMFFLFSLGLVAILYALYELSHYGVYYPDAGNPRVYTGWNAVIELGPAILAITIAAMAFSLWIFISYFKKSESRRIQGRIDGYTQALMDAKDAHTAKQNTLFQNYNMEIATVHRHYRDADDVLREDFAQKEKSWLLAIQNARQDAIMQLQERTEALNSRESHLNEQERALKEKLAEVRSYVARERHNATLARQDAQTSEKRRQNASATAERRRRKLEKQDMAAAATRQKL